jgi:hypothetical protein
MTDENDAQNGQLSILECIPGPTPDLSRGLGSEAHQVVSRGDVTPHTCKAKTNQLKSNTNEHTNITLQKQSSITPNKKRLPKITVRLKQHQLDTLKTIAHTLGHSIPTLLRDAFFKKDPPTPIHSHEDALLLHKDLLAIGEDVNRIARAIDSGIREGFNVHFQRFEEAFLKFQSMNARNRGVR